MVVRPKYSCGLAVVVLEQPTDSFATLDWRLTIIGRWLIGKWDSIAESLVTPLSMIIRLCRKSGCLGALGRIMPVQRGDYAASL